MDNGTAPALTDPAAAAAAAMEEALMFLQALKDGQIVNVRKPASHDLLLLTRVTVCH